MAAFTIASITVNLLSVSISLKRCQALMSLRVSRVSHVSSNDKFRVFVLLYWMLSGQLCMNNKQLRFHRQWASAIVVVNQMLQLRVRQSAQLSLSHFKRRDHVLRQLDSSTFQIVHDTWGDWLERQQIKPAKGKHLPDCLHNDDSF